MIQEFKCSTSSSLRVEIII